MSPRALVQPLGRSVRVAAVAAVGRRPPEGRSRRSTWSTAAEQTFSELVGRVGDAMTAGLLASGDEVDVAQQIWNAMHGAATLELAGVTFSAHPERTFASMLDALLAGLASP